MVGVIEFVGNIIGLTFDVIGRIVRYAMRWLLIPLVGILFIAGRVFWGSTHTSKELWKAGDGMQVGIFSIPFVLLFVAALGALALAMLASSHTREYAKTVFDKGRKYIVLLLMFIVVAAYTPSWHDPMVAYGVLVLVVAWMLLKGSVPDFLLKIILLAGIAFGLYVLFVGDRREAVTKATTTVERLGGFVSKTLEPRKTGSATEVAPKAPEASKSQSQPAATNTGEEFHYLLRGPGEARTLVDFKEVCDPQRLGGNPRYQLWDDAGGTTLACTQEGECRSLVEMAETSSGSITTFARFLSFEGRREGTTLTVRCL